jgi:hypothetical protein
MQELQQTEYSEVGLFRSVAGYSRIGKGEIQILDKIYILYIQCRKENKGIQREMLQRYFKNVTLKEEEKEVDL